MSASRQSSQVSQASQASQVPYEYMMASRPRTRPRTQAPKTQCSMCGSWGTWDRSKWNLVEHQKRDICKKNRINRSLDRSLESPYPVGSFSRGHQVSPLPLPSPAGHVVSAAGIAAYQQLRDTQNQQIYNCREPQNSIGLEEIDFAILQSGGEIVSTQESSYIDAPDVNASQFLSTVSSLSSFIMSGNLLKTQTDPLLPPLPAQSSSLQQLVHQNSVESFGSIDYGANTFIPNYFSDLPSDYGNLASNIESTSVESGTVDSQGSQTGSQYGSVSRKRRKSEDDKFTTSIFRELQQKLVDFSDENKRLKTKNDDLEREMKRQKRQLEDFQAQSFFNSFFPNIN